MCTLRSSNTGNISVFVSVLFRGLKLKTVFIESPPSAEPNEFSPQ